MHSFSLEKGMWSQIFERIEVSSNLVVNCCHFYCWLDSFFLCDPLRCCTTCCLFLTHSLRFFYVCCETHKINSAHPPCLACWKTDRDKIEKDNDSEEESSDYSCSSVTKNELLTAAKYRAIKFRHRPCSSSYLDPSVPFHLSKPLSRLLVFSIGVEPRKTGENSLSRSLSLFLPPFHFPSLRVSISWRLFARSCLFSPFFFVRHSYILFIITLHLIYYFLLVFSVFSYVLLQNLVTRIHTQSGILYNIHTRTHTVYIITVKKK